MDKETLSNYGWIVIAVMVLVVMIALATPFGNFVKGAVVSTVEGIFGVNQNALNAVGIHIDDQAVEQTMGKMKIDNVEYEFEKDMTWADWVESDYNTMGLKKGNSHITKDEMYITYAIGFTNTNTTKSEMLFYEMVQQNDKIINNCEYASQDEAFTGLVGPIQEGGKYMFVDEFENREVRFNQTIYTYESVTFKINGDTHTTQKGLTWLQYLEGDGSSKGIPYNAETGVLEIVFGAGEIVYISDVIVEGGIYTMSLGEWA